MTDSAKLLAEIDGFLARSGMAETTFGAKAANNSKLVGRLRSGGSVSLETAARIREFMARGNSQRA